MLGREFWDISPVWERKPPIPNGISCPVCGGKRIYFKHASIFKRKDGEYRMDIAVKCASCALVLTFGVHITEEEFNELRKIIGSKLDYSVTGHVLLNS